MKKTTGNRQHAKKVRTNPARTIRQFIAITSRYLGATDYKGSRVKLELPRWKKTRIIPYDHSYNDADEIARAWLATQGILPPVFLDTGPTITYAVPWHQLDRVLAAFKVKP